MEALTEVMMASDCSGGSEEEKVKVYFVLGGDGGGGSSASEEGGRGPPGEDDNSRDGSCDSEETIVDEETAATVILEKCGSPIRSYLGGDSNRGGGEELGGSSIPEEGGSKGEGGKKSVCDSDYSTPQKPSMGFYNHPVKRRLHFGSATDFDGGDGSSSSDGYIPSGGDLVTTKRTEEEETHLEERERRKRKKKRRRDKTVVIVGSGNKTRQIIASTSTSSQHQPGDGSVLGQGATSGEEGDKENKSVGGAVTSGAPPRRIAQLVVWTKNLGGGGNTGSGRGQESGDGESRGGGGKRKKEEASNKSSTSAEGAVVELQPNPTTEREVVSSSVVNVSSEVNENSGGGAKKKGGGTSATAEVGGTAEGDLFFVQYPARPFSDQGKGKGKPFRRLNSYNDPIVIKKTPPPPVPSSRRRGGAGGEGKRKRGGNNTSNHPNRKEPVGICHHPLQQHHQEAIPHPLVIDQQGHQAFQAYLQQVHHHHQPPDQLYLHPQEYFLNQNLANVTTGLPGGGQIITLPYPHHQFVQGGPPPHHHLPTSEVVHPHQEYIPTTESAEFVVSSDTDNSAPPVIILSTGQGGGPIAAPPTQSGAGVPSLEAVQGSECPKTAPPASGEGGNSTVFDLPERFTVTTSTVESGNEFDLLIHNVVHEEMVSDIGEEDMARYEERLRKRMRLSVEGREAPPMEEEEKGDGDSSGGGGGENSRGSQEGGGSGPDEPGKPRCTYTELIEKALTESGGLTVSEIYNWISERYPYYRQDDDRWKNSVRHNLSINPYFKKGEKARSGAGHLWTISEESKGLRPSMVSCLDERRKSPCDPGDLLLSMDNDTDRAVANILGMYRSKVAAAEKERKEDNGGDPEQDLQQVHQQQQQPTSDPLEPPTNAMENGHTMVTSEHPPPPSTSEDLSTATITLNELNTGQFTVDLSGITIPEGGTINFDELVSNGRLIFIQTTGDAPSDPEANKENEEMQHQHNLMSSADNILAELGGSVGGHHQQQQMMSMSEDPNRSGFNNGYYTDPGLNLDLGGASGEYGGGKGGENNNLHGMLTFGGADGFPPTTTSTPVSTSAPQELTMVPPSEVIAPITSAESHHHHQQQHHHDLDMLDQVLHPLSSAYQQLCSTSGGSLTTTTTSDHSHHLHHHLPQLNEAALYESKELGISYTFQTEAPPPPSSSLLSDHPHLHQHSDLLQ